MSDRLTVVFDLDETLIHGSHSIPAEWADFMSGSYRCMIRPHAPELIEDCLGKYNVGIWTSAGVHHATSVVEALFDDPERLHFVWSAERCTEWRDFELNEMVSIKDLRKLKRLGLDLNQTVAIDDSPDSAFSMPARTSTTEHHRQRSRTKVWIANGDFGDRSR